MRVYPQDRAPPVDAVHDSTLRAGLGREDIQGYKGCRTTTRWYWRYDGQDIAR